MPLCKVIGNLRFVNLNIRLYKLYIYRLYENIRIHYYVYKDVRLYKNIR